MADEETENKSKSAEPEKAASQAQDKGPVSSEEAAKLEQEEKDDAEALAAIDNVLNETDPAFVNSVSEIDESLGSDADIEITDFEALQNQAHANVRGIKRILYRWLPFLPKLLIKLQGWKLHFKLWAQDAALKTLRFLKYLATDGVKLVIAKIKSGIGAVTGAIKIAFKTFGEYSLSKKLAFVGLVALSVVCIYLLYRTLSGQLIQIDEKLFLTSFEATDAQVYTYEKGEVEVFYDSLRFPQNIFQLPKMVVNLRSSKSSGPNPMGNFEFFVDAASQDTLVEMKARETEMVDLVQRSLEEMSYDQVVSPQGKSDLRDKLREVLNAQLASGRVRRVMIRNMIVKP